MRVLLAGYNVDTTVLEQARDAGVDAELLTPEPLSAAYARISRYRRPVDELRARARSEVAAARRSNRTIIFGMGHHSVAEHAVFNLDLIGLSRLAIEAIEHFRLCSFTEKSQRYITLDGDVVIPEEVRAQGLEGEFTELIGEQNALYARIKQRIVDDILQRQPDRGDDRAALKLVHGEAKEDARYVTALATEGQLGMTLNARNLELIVRRLAAHPLAEVRQLGTLLHDRVVAVAPSLLLFVEACDHDRLTYGELAEVARRSSPSEDTDGATPDGSRPARRLASGAVRLVGATDDGDRRLVAALLHTVSGDDYARCYERAAGMSQGARGKLVTASMAHMELYDAVLREFEHVGFTFELEVSAACFGQLKRHRMSTLTTQPYDPDLGLTIPAAIDRVGLAPEVRQLAERSARFAARIEREEARPYALLNAHRRRVLMTLDARELYHVSRLREDHHAQWDIRAIAAEMVRQARDVMPLTMILTGGKDAYARRFEDLFGRPPAVVEPTLPGDPQGT